MTPNLAKPRVGMADDDEKLCSCVHVSLRGAFEALDGHDYEDVFRLLKQNDLDVLLLGLPIPAGQMY